MSEPVSMRYLLFEVRSVMNRRPVIGRCRLPPSTTALLVFQLVFAWLTAFLCFCAESEVVIALFVLRLTPGSASALTPVSFIPL